MQRKTMSEKKLEIVLAENAGFCMGVRRALQTTLEAANDVDRPRPIKTEGPLIHNRQVLDVLNRKGVRALEGPDDEAGTVVIRAHGVPPQKQRELEDRTRELIDATCPHVSNVQRIAQRYCKKGYHCVIVGDPGHAEVDGVLSYAGDRGIVIEGPQQVDDLPPMDKVVVVAQTTQDEQVYEEVVSRIRDRYPDAQVFDTICRATHRRQAEAKELAGQVDAMVVVGGYNSANTCRLAAICSETGTPTFHVETEKELPLDRLLECERIGVTAGASTPNWMIRRVLGRIRTEHERRCRSITHWMRQLVTIPVRFNIILGGGAAAMTYANSRLIGLHGPTVWLAALLAFLFITSQHLLHQYGKRETMYLDEPERGEFIRENAGSLFRVGALAGGLALLLALMLGWVTFGLVVVGSGIGILYSLPSDRGVGAVFRGGGLHTIPGSKELFVGLAWAVITSLAPATAKGVLREYLPAVLVSSGLAFLFAFHRTLLTDLSDVEGDQLAGRETLAVVLGPKGSFRLLGVLLALEAILLLGAGAFRWTTPVSYVILGAVIYGGTSSLLFRRGKLPQAELGEALIDGQFYACALLAFLGTLR